MTPEDQKALEAIAAAEAAGNDPFGDDEPLTVEDASGSAAASASGAASSAAEPEAGQAAADTPAAEAVQANADPAPAVASTEAAELPTYKAEVPQDYKAQRADLMKAKADAMKQLMDGEIDAEAYAAEDARVSEALEDLAAARIRAETLQEANAQSQQAYQARAIQRLIANTKSEVDYAADATAQKQFDTSLQVLAAQPDNAGKDFADLIEDAHKMVKAMRGIAQAPKQPAADRKPAGDAPVTLRSLPSASTPNTGGVIEQIARLKGPAYEAAYAKLTPAQQAALLDE
jgi:hypothetical protein